MERIKLEPFAARLEIRCPENDSEPQFNQAILSLAASLAQRCLQEEGGVIGHIKGFARGPEGSWLRVSVVDGRRPVESDGHIAGRPTNVDFTLNIHVLGIGAGRIGELLMDAIDEITADTGVSVVLKNSEGSECAGIRS